MEAFTLFVYLYVGGGRHDRFTTHNLSAGDCAALAEEVQRTQLGAYAWCRQREPICAHGGGSCAWPLLPGRKRV